MLRKGTLLNCILLNVAIFSVNELRREELVWIIFCFYYITPFLILYFLVIKFRWYAIVCRLSSDVAIKIWSSAYSIVFTNLLFSCIPFFITILNSCIIT